MDKWVIAFMLVIFVLAITGLLVWCVITYPVAGLILFLLFVLVGGTAYIHGLLEMIE